MLQSLTTVVVLLQGERKGFRVLLRRTRRKSSRTGSQLSIGLSLLGR